VLQPIIGLAGALLLLIAVGILRSYLIHYAAKRAGYGDGRSTLGWLLMGFSGASPLAVFRTGGKAKEIETEMLPCPRCRESRRFYDGFCTVCGCEVMAALIEEARQAEALNPSTQASPQSEAQPAPQSEAESIEDWQEMHTLGDEPEENDGHPPKLNL
jgi:hypothetical protein